MHRVVLPAVVPFDQKSGRLACSGHLDRWVERKERHALELASEFEPGGIICDLRSSLRIASWAHTQTFDCRGLTWLREDELVPLQPDWNKSLTRCRAVAVERLSRLDPFHPLEVRRFLEFSEA